MTEYTVTMHPPEYPDRLHPWTCDHHSRFKVVAAAHITPRKNGGNQIEYDHMVCLGCGAPLKTTVGGNVLVDLSEVCRQQVHHMPMFRRAWHLRDRWIRLAVKLFGPDGWNGRHERVARTIDPHLTMRLEPAEDGLARCWFDESYLRSEDEGHDDDEVRTPRDERVRPEIAG